VYQWFVFTHLVGLILFVFAHGASAFASYQIRALRDPLAIGGYLSLSQQAVRTSYIGLLLLLIGGAGAATVNDLWGQPWVWSSIIVLVVVVAAMYGVGSRYYMRLRTLLMASEGKPPVSQDALGDYLDSRVPDALAGIGALGLLVLTWLMVMKPG
jgi:Predicted integral membrane protein (DUF2269)